MPQGYSYNRDHFTTFEDGIHTFFDEGFVDKTFTLNASLKTDKAGADLHETFAENPKGLNNKSQNRFWVNVKDDKSVFATLSSDFLSLHYDNGIKTS